MTDGVGGILIVTHCDALQKKLQTQTTLKYES
jgi:hypothetical protein